MYDCKENAHVSMKGNCSVILKIILDRKRHFVDDMKNKFLLLKCLSVKKGDIKGKSHLKKNLFNFGY